MRHGPLGLTLLVALMLLGPARAAAAEPKPPGAATIDFHGYSNCILLDNGTTRVVLCPAAGGRVLEYSWKGTNALYLDASQGGRVYEEGQPTFGPSGGRFDIGPENVIPKHPKLWIGKWTGEITGPLAARMTSLEDSATGTQLVREFRLDRSSSHLSCKQTIKNISKETKAWCHWSRTFAEGGGICLIPLTEGSRFPNQYVMYEPDSLINVRPEDANIRIRDGFLEITGTPKYPKLGMDSYAGWFGYLMKNDLLFVKRFPTYPDRVYNEMAGLTISIWYYKRQMCELEPIGPMERLAPGESASFTEQWQLFPYTFPKPSETVDLKDVARLVKENAP